MRALAMRLTVLLIGVGSATKATAQVSSTDRLVVFQRNGASQELIEIDTALGEYGAVRSSPTNAAAPFALASSGAWLYALDSVQNQTDLLRVNPADGTSTTIGPLSPLSAGNLCSHPVTGELLVWGYSSPTDVRPDLFVVDPQTAQSTLLLSDLTGFAGGVFAQCIDNAGNGWFVVNPRSLYRLDLSIGHATFHGHLAGLPNSGAVGSLAVSSSGVLFAKFVVSTFSPLNGFYRIDPGTLTATKIASITPPTLAFAPGLRETTYCTAKTNSLGCVPSIGGHGYASVSADEGLDVWGENVLNETNGLLFFGVAGRYSYPWHGGTLCVRPPLTRTPVRSSGGDPWPAHNCSGRWALDFNSALAALPPLAAGTVVDLQWYGRDTGFAPPNNYQFTDALEFTLRP